MYMHACIIAKKSELRKMSVGSTPDLNEKTPMSLAELANY